MNENKIKVSGEGREEGAKFKYFEVVISVDLEVGEEVTYSSHERSKLLGTMGKLRKKKTISREIKMSLQ